VKQFLQLLGASTASAAGGKDKDRNDSGERHTKLRRYEQVACQTLNPFGPSAIATCPLGKLWAAAAAGNKKAMFFSEFASKDPVRRGIAISRLAETLEELKTCLADASLKAIVKEEIWKKAHDELEALSPSLAILNGGKREGDSVGLWNLSSSGGQSKDEADVKEAAKVMYNWLNNGASPLRGFLAILSAGGMFFSAFALEKTARSATCASGGNITKDEFVTAAVARLAVPRGCESSGDGGKAAAISHLLKGGA